MSRSDVALGCTLCDPTDVHLAQAQTLDVAGVETALIIGNHLIRIPLLKRKCHVAQNTPCLALDATDEFLPGEGT